MTQPTKKIIENKFPEVMSFVLGSCKSISQVCQEFHFPDDAEDFLEQMLNESEIYLCPTCGWWCALDDMLIANESKYDDECKDCADAEYD